MKKKWTEIALALGPAIMLASIFWEYARTSPDYNFLIEPWSVRGFEIVHGAVIGVAAALLLLGSLLTSMQRAMKPRNSALIVSYIVVAATGFTAMFARDSITITISPSTNVILSILLGSVLSLALRSLLGDSVKLLSRATLTLIPLSLVFFLLFAASIMDDPISVPAWLLVFIVFLTNGMLSIAIQPIDMSANRMLLMASVAGWGLVTFSAGAIRQSLIDIQMVTDQGGGVFGIAAPYKDTQAAGGWWLAGFGGFVMFIGAVGLWAKRRDVVAAVARAKRQRAAAEQSAREIQDAADAYAREHETTAAS